MIHRRRTFDSTDHTFFEETAKQFKELFPGATLVHMLLIRQGGAISEGDLELRFHSSRDNSMLMRIETDSDRAWKAMGIGSALESALLRYGVTVKHGPAPEFDTARANKAKRDAIKRAEESETTTSEA